MKANQTLFYLREFFFPFGCSICGKVLLDAKEAWYGLCHECYGGIENDLADNNALEKCNYCGKPLISERERCLSCRNGNAYAFDRADVLFPYTGKYQRLLAAYKFKKNIALGNFFADKIIEIVTKNYTQPEAAIVPVPPKPGKIRKNGWDQIDYIAGRLEKNPHVPHVSRCLRRLSSVSQKELGRANRQTNLKGRIVTVKNVPRIAVVIDDVMTTGSTLDACAAALKAGGAQAIYGLCLFYD